MRRITADLLLGLAGLIWGFGFVAQKDALDDVGPATFIAAKFLISAVFVLPFVWREIRATGIAYLRPGQNSKRRIFALCAVFTVSVLTQQYGLLVTNVTKAAFLTGLYVVMVPFAGLILYRQEISPVTLLACFLSLIGVGLLTGGGAATLMGGFTWGDGLILICAIFYAVQVPMLGHTVGAMNAPFVLSFLQYLSGGLVALVLALAFENISLHALAAAWVSIAYSGIAAGGIAYTLQAIAQQHTPATDGAIIMSSETLFGAIGGAWLMHDKLTSAGYVGCAVIMAAIVMVELIPYLKTRYARA